MPGSFRSCYFPSTLVKPSTKERRSTSPTCDIYVQGRQAATVRLASGHLTLLAWLAIHLHFMKDPSVTFPWNERSHNTNKTVPYLCDETIHRDQKKQNLTGYRLCCFHAIAHSVSFTWNIAAASWNATSGRFRLFEFGFFYQKWLSYSLLIRSTASCSWVAI